MLREEVTKGEQDVEMKGGRKRIQTSRAIDLRSAINDRYVLPHPSFHLHLNRGGREIRTFPNHSLHEETLSVAPDSRMLSIYTGEAVFCLYILRIIDILCFF